MKAFDAVTAGFFGIGVWALVFWYAVGTILNPMGLGYPALFIAIYAVICAGAGLAAWKFHNTWVRILLLSSIPVAAFNVFRWYAFGFTF